MRILYLTCAMLVMWAQSLYANVMLPSFRYSQNSVAVFKAKLHSDNVGNPFKYVTTGIFFKKGSVRDIHNLSATDLSTEFPLQIKPHNYYPDGSLRFALVTVYVHKNQKNHDIHIVKAPSKFRAMPHITFQQPLNIQVHITTAQGEKHIFDLRKARPEKDIWNTGPLLSQKRFHTSLFKGMNIDFDVTQYHTGQYHTDITFHYDRIKKTPMTDIQYRADIYVNGKLFKKFDQMIQHHHTRWRYPVHFGYKHNNSSLIDMRQAMAVGAFPQFDLSLGTDLGKIEQDYAKTQSHYQSIHSSGLLIHDMPRTGGRDEIGIIPQWAARYVVSGHDKARDVVLKHAEIASHIPWNFYDSKTHRPANALDHPNIWINYRATLQKNNIVPFKGTSPWKVDIAHQPSLTYLPFIMTGDRYHYDTMKAVYMSNRLRISPFWPEKNTKYRKLSYAQIRSYGWFRRAASEMQSILDVKSDPDADYVQKANHSDLDYFYKKLFLYGNFTGKKGQPSLEGQHQNIMGELTGVLTGYGNLYDKGVTSNFMQDLSAIGIGFGTGLGFQPWLKEFSLWQSHFIAGRFLQKNNGFPPEFGTMNFLAQYITDDKGHKTISSPYMRILKRWRDVYNLSVQNGVVGKFQSQIQQYGLAGYPTSGQSYAAYARGSNAQLFNVTRNPDNLEAFGFLAQFIHLAHTSYIINPSYRISPVFDDGMQLSYNDIEIGSDGNNDINADPYSLVHAGKGNDVITLSRPASKAFLFGGEGNDVLNAAKGAGAYLFGGNGNDILIASSGDDTLKGDEYYGQGRDVFMFTGQNIGVNIIQDFNPKQDIMKFCLRQDSVASFDIRSFLKISKKGVTYIDFPQGQAFPYSGKIFLKNVQKSQITAQNIQFSKSCY